MAEEPQKQDKSLGFLGLLICIFLTIYNEGCFSTVVAEESFQDEKTLEHRKLDLEVKELEKRVQKLDQEVEQQERGRTGWGKVEYLIPIIIIPSVTVAAVILGNYLTARSGGKKHRLETLTNLKKDIASENLAVRIAAVYALADYPKEAIPVLIHSLGRTKSVQKEGQSQPEEDTEFTTAVKDALLQIGKKKTLFRHTGKKVAYELIVRLRRIQTEIRDTIEEVISCKGRALPLGAFAVENAYIRGILKEIAKEIAEAHGMNNVDDVLKTVRSLRSEAVLANKNGTETLAYMLLTQRHKRLNLERIDLSGADLDRANLSGAYLDGANLSGVNLTRADLSGARLGFAYLLRANLGLANLSGAYLFAANLSGASLRKANLSNTDLSQANLSGADFWQANLLSANLNGANLEKVEEFKEIKDFRKADLRGVKGLSGEDLAFAKESGAIVDEPEGKSTVGTEQ